MPNIVVVRGFRAGDSDIWEVTQAEWISIALNDLGEEIQENCVITIPSARCFNLFETKQEAPYVIVRDTDAERADKIADALHRFCGNRMDIEVEVIHRFIPKNNPSSKG